MVAACRACSLVSSAVEATYTPPDHLSCSPPTLTLVSKPPSLKYSRAARRLRDLGAYLARQGGEHEIWRCGCGEHQTALPRHNTVSSYVVCQIGKQMPCLGEEWWR